MPSSFFVKNTLFLTNLGNVFLAFKDGEFSNVLNTGFIKAVDLTNPFVPTPPAIVSCSKVVSLSCIVKGTKSSSDFCKSFSSL